MLELRKTPRDRSRILQFIFVTLLAGGGILARAEDINVAEVQTNSFQPQRVTRVKILDDSRHPKKVKKIVWNREAIRVMTREFGKSSESVLVLEGELKRENSKKWHLVWNEKDTTLDADGKFHLEIPFDPSLKAIQLLAIAPLGDVEYHFYRYQLVIPPPPPPVAPPDPEGYRPPVLTQAPPVEVPAPVVTPAAPSIKPTIPTQSQPESVPEPTPVEVVNTVPGTTDLKFNQKIDRRLFVSPGLGFSSIHVNQSDHDPYSSLVSTVKVSANYLLAPPKWDLGFTGFFNFATLSKSLPTDVRFLGLNLRAGYIFPEVTAPWRLALYGGVYYSTMFASDSTFGYKNIAGPQLFPAIRRTLANGQGIGAYFKFSPISSSLGFLNLNSNEIAFGLSYLIPTASRTFSVSLDYSRLHLLLDDVSLTSESLSLGGSVTF